MWGIGRLVRGRHVNRRIRRRREHRRAHALLRLDWEVLLEFSSHL